MFRGSRARKDKRLDRAIKGLSVRSLVATLEAASISPTECRRLPGLMSLFASAVTATETKGAPVRPDDYARLVALSEKGEDDTDYLEAKPPLWIQPAVLVRWRGHTFRFLPDAKANEHVEFEVLERICSVIDPVLVRDEGYGLGDVVELTLRRIDHVVSGVAKMWPAEASDDTLLTSQEIEAALPLSSLSALAGECLYPDRALRALERFTAPPEVLADLEGDWHVSGPAIGVWAHGRAEDDRVPLLAGSLRKPLYDIAELLTDRAMVIDPRIEMAIDFELGNLVFDEMREAGHPMRGMIRLDEGEQTTIHLVAKYEDRGVLLIDVGAASGNKVLGARVEKGAKNIYDFASGAAFQSAGVDLDDLAGMEMKCIQVLYGIGWRLSAGRSGFEVLNAHAFLDMVRSMDSPEDLWAVLSDKETLENLAGERAMSLVNMWRMWKDHGNRIPIFAPAFRDVPIITGKSGEEVAAHPGFSEVQRVLANFGMPELSMWPEVFREGDVVVLLDAATGLYGFMLVWEVPVVVVASRSLAEASPEGYTWEMGTLVTLRLMEVREALISSASDCGLDALHVTVMKDPDAQAAVIRVVERTASTVVIGWSDTCPEVQYQDPSFVDMMVGNALAECFHSQPASDAFFQAWKRTNPFSKENLPR